MKYIANLIRPYISLIVLVCVAAYLMGTHLNRDYYWDWDECAYGQYAVEMKQTGNLLTNQWNDKLVFEKPPLNSWLTQIPFLFNVSEGSARTVPLIESLLLLSAVYIFAKKYFSQKTALLASLILLASEIIIIYSVRVNTDIGFTLFTFLGVWAWIATSQKRSYSILAGFFLGLAVMNKGLSITPFIAALFISIFLKFEKHKLLEFAKLIGAFLATIVPWHAYQLIVHGREFFQVYFLEHIIKRANNPLDFHFESRLFYGRLLMSNFYPWIFAIITLPIYYIINIKRLFKKSFILQELKDKQLLFTLLLLIGLPLLSITLVKTRIAWYAMPIYPFVAILIAYCINFASQKLRNPFIATIFALFIGMDAFGLIYHEVRFTQSTQEVSSRNEVFIEARKYPDPQIDYLVQFSERRANDILAPHLKTSTTFIYGGNPCAVYYSEKNVRYYYSVEEFQKSISSRKGLYVVESGDFWIADNLPVKILHKNADFILFEYK